METLLDIRAIQDILPHRYPFLLVDRIVELTRGVRIVGVKQVTINEHFFQGHFPGAPVMPGVLILEAMAQVGAVYALQQIEGRESKLVLFSGIDITSAFIAEYNTRNPATASAATPATPARP